MESYPSDPLDRLRVLLGPVSLLPPEDALEVSLPLVPRPITANPVVQFPVGKRKTKSKSRKSRQQPLGVDPEEQIEAAAPFDNSNLVAGRTYPDLALTPWTFVKSYPDRFIGKKNKPRARPFFDDIFVNRTWPFFYIYHPDKPADRPTLFVTTVAFLAFLAHINTQLKIKLTIPPDHEAMFEMKFGRAPAFVPRYLSACNDRDALASLVDSTVPRSSTDTDATPDTEESRSILLEHLDLVATGRIAPPPRPAALEHAASMNNLLCWLGLRASDGPPGPLVFISVDTESIEIMPGALSEVGLAILDMREVGSIEPGPSGRAWFGKMHGYHIRVSEYATLRNSQYVYGCPDKFGFGQSTFATTRDLPAAVEQIISQHTQAGADTLKPEIITVGHDVRQDLVHLKRVGVNMPGSLDTDKTADTKELHQHWLQATQPTSLVMVLEQLQIPYEHLHNAGNDAMHTLQALVGLAFTEPPRQGDAKPLD